MKTKFYSDGQGFHRVTLEPENETERALIAVMSLHRCEIKASKVATGLPDVKELDGLEISFSEAGRNLA